ncbi:MAG: histidine phosphatase family protein [Pseudomonadota bacterium]
MPRIIILRHGNTFDKNDVVRRVGKQTDIPLSSSGRQQVEKLAAFFVTSGFRFSRVVSSPLKRTQETARTVLSAYPHAPDVEIDQGLVEIDYGPDDGKPESHVIARIGPEAMEQWERNALAPDGWHVDPTQIKSFWAQLFQSLKQEKSDVLIVTSNGVARFAIDAIGASWPDKFPKLKTAHFGIVSIDASGDYSVLGWNKSTV